MQDSGRNFTFGMSSFGKKENGYKLYNMFIMRKFEGKWDFGFSYGLFGCYVLGLSLESEKVWGKVGFWVSLWSIWMLWIWIC